MVPKGCGRAGNPAASCRALAKKEGPPFPRGLPRAIRREEAPDALLTAGGVLPHEPDEGSGVRPRALGVVRFDGTGDPVEEGRCRRFLLVGT